MKKRWRPTERLETSASDQEDRLIARRKKLARMAGLGRRIGYLAFGVAIGVLALGLATNFTNGVATVVIGLLAGGSAMLAPAILLQYAIRGAEREDAERGS